MFAVSVPRKDMAQPLFACEATDSAFNKYFAGKADLHFVFREAIGRNYYFLDLGPDELSENRSLALQLATKEEADNPSFWPQVGFFSRAHQNPFLTSNAPTAIQAFAIDGKWGATDFSHFHAKMSDLYSLFAVLNGFDGANARLERSFMAEIIQERFWQGGGSYGAFYDDLYSRNQLNKISPLEVARLQYASPGQIALRGELNALGYTSDVIAMFDENADELRRAYREIHGALRKAKLLRAKPNTRFPSRAIENWVLTKTRDLANAMKLEKIDDIYRACGEKTLVFSKVILSIHRRALELYMFHAEGRVQRLK
jgi:hypothetical protein